MKIKQKLIYAFTALSMLVASSLMFLPSQGFAQNSDIIQNAVCKGSNDLEITSKDASSADCPTDSTDGPTSKVNKVIRQIINIFSTIVGVIAVIMIVWGGLRYITSGGDSNKLSSAKNTIIYALIGLIIVALSQFIVRFVLAKATES